MPVARTRKWLILAIGVLGATAAIATIAVADPLGPPFTLSPEKRAFEAAYQAARSAEAAAAHASKPAVLATPNVNVRNVAGLGISEYQGTPVKGAKVNTQANVLSSSGSLFTVYAGVLDSDATQGVFIVLDRSHDDGAIQRSFALRPGSGAPRLIGIDGDTVLYTTPSGVGRFEFTTGIIR